MAICIGIIGIDSIDVSHLEIKKLVWREATVRLFPKWAMRDDPTKSWLWNKKQIENGALEKASEEDLVSVFSKLASDLDKC